MGVGRNGVVARQGQAILSEDLAPLVARVGSRASLWQGIVGIEDIELVDVIWQELGAIDLEISEESSSLVHSGNIGAANVGLTVPRLNSCVQPSILLGHGHHILDLHVHASGDLSDLLDRFANCSKTLIQSLGE